MMNTQNTETTARIDDEVDADRIAAHAAAQAVSEYRCTRNSVSPQAMDRIWQHAYDTAYRRVTDTHHTCSQSERAFGRRAAGCPRCAELAAGAPARNGWQQDYFAAKAHNERVAKLSREAHYAPGGPHATGKCGPVCTFNDW